MKRFISFLILFFYLSVSLASVTVTVNGSNHTIPQTNERGWGASVTAWIQAISQYTLQPNGGTFSLTNDVDFGSNYGLKSKYFQTRNANPAQNGIVRLSNADSISFRNSANTADLNLNLTSDKLYFNAAELLTASSTSTVTGKSINGDLNTLTNISISSLKTNITDASKFIVRDATGAVVSNTKAVPTGVVVGTTDTQTLTNKTIDASTNTVSNIVDSNISASAAITRTKIANGTANHVLINSAGGVVSSEAQLASTRGGTGVSNAGTLTYGANNLTFTTSGVTSVALPTSGTMATLAGTETFTNKTLTSPTINTPSINVSTLTEQASAPANPSAGFRKFYVKTDGKAYLLDSAGSERALGSGGGGINLISTGDAESGTTGFSTYNDAAGTSPVDGTGGTPTATWTTSATSPLYGANSFLLTKGATNRQGDGASYAFTVDPAFRAKSLQISFDYIVSSGTFVAGNPSDLSSAGNSDVTVWLYDVTNSTLIQPSNYRLYSNSSTISDKFSATFQTSATGSSYRLIFHIGSTSANAYTLKFDNVSVSPSTYVYGSPITDWQSWTPTVSNLGTGTTTTNTAKYRRVGDSIEMMIYFLKDGSAGSGASVVTWSLPNGFSVDTSKIPSGSATAKADNIGHAWVVSGGNYSANDYEVLINSSNTLAISKPTTASQLTGADIGSGVYIIIRATVPILGWSSSVQMSDGFDGRVIAAKVLRSTNQTINTTATDIVWDSVSKDEVGGYNSSTGVYTIISPGWYEFTSNIRLDTGASAPGQFVFEYAVNGTGNIVGAPTDLIASKSYFFNPVYQDYFKAGDQIKLRITSATNSSTLIAGQNGWYIRKLSSPQTISATEQISASYRSDSSQSLTTGATLKIFGATNKLKDTHGAWNNTLGVFTCPATGDYRVSFNFFTADATSTPAEITLRRNTTGVIRAQPKSHGTNQYSWSGSITIPCNANDTLDFFITVSAAGTIYNAAVDNWFSIERIK